VKRDELASLMKGIAPVVRDFVDSKLADLTARVKELEARPQVHDAGVHHAGVTYDEGAIVTFNGSAWICSIAHVAKGNEIDHQCFRLFVKSGRNGRDAK
jgi:hypothetical protein